MGTTLTGTTPQDTYDSLIKVTNNGPLSSTARYLSDGLGNDSVLALSTTSVGIGTTSPSGKLHVAGGDIFIGASYALKFSSTSYMTPENNVSGAEISTAGVFVLKTGSTPAERLRVDASGNVGIGTSSPVFKLDVGGVSPVVAINRTSGDQPKLAFAASGTEYGSIISNGSIGENRFSMGPSVGWGGYHTFYTNTVERVRITDNGLTFNGDTAAANALDDYEEGTWTPSLAFGGASVGITYNVRYGRYTKIGNQVNATCYIELSSKGSSTGGAVVGGLPFNNNSASGNYAAPAIWFQRISYANILNAIISPNGTGLSLTEITEAGTLSSITDADFQNTSEIIINLTYAV